MDKVNLYHSDGRMCKRASGEARTRAWALTSPPFAPGGTGSASSASEAASGGGIALRIARQLNGSSKSSRTCTLQAERQRGWLLRAVYNWRRDR
eukprot:5550115-Pleurochrysis_carterae.AAC.5